MLKTSLSDYEKSSVVTYPFYFINRQSIHKTNCMQRIKNILMRKVFPAIALKSMRISLDHFIYCIVLYICKTIFSICGSIFSIICTVLGHVSKRSLITSVTTIHGFDNQK